MDDTAGDVESAPIVPATRVPLGAFGSDDPPSDDAEFEDNPDAEDADEYPPALTATRVS